MGEANQGHDLQICLICSYTDMIYMNYKSPESSRLDISLGNLVIEKQLKGNNVS